MTGHRMSGHPMSGGTPYECPENLWGDGTPMSGRDPCE